MQMNESKKPALLGTSDTTPPPLAGQRPVARWLEQSVVVSSLSNSSVVDFRHLVSLLGSFVDHVYTPTTDAV
jgi:hypothetical protein